MPSAKKKKIGEEPNGSTADLTWMSSALAICVQLNAVYAAPSTRLLSGNLPRCSYGESCAIQLDKLRWMDSNVT